VKMYKLTVMGKKQLASQRSRWEKLLKAMAGVLNAGTVTQRSRE
jgi:DNA-binding PadR family transcriptional regulator